MSGAKGLLGGVTQLRCNAVKDGTV